MEVVQGEMQEWTDYSGASYAAGGPVLERLLRDALPSRVGSALAVGPHSAALISILAGTADKVTLLVRSMSDAQRLATELPDNVTVVAGGLDSFSADRPGSYDALVALDGLDRVLSFDSAGLSWVERLRALLSLGADDAWTIVAGAHELAPVNVLDARPSADRYADEEWRPLHSDTSRPVSHDALVATLADQGRGEPLAWLTFGPTSAARTVVAATAADPAGDLLIDQAVAGALATRRPLLASPAELVRAHARAGRLPDAADGSVVTLGQGSPTRDLYAVVSGGALVAADRAADRWTVRSSDDVSATEWGDQQVVAAGDRDTAQGSETMRYVEPLTEPQAPSPVVRTSTALVPAGVSASASVQTELLRLAEQRDIPAFRDLAARIGRYVETTPVADRRVLTLDDTFVDGIDLVPGLSGREWSETASTGVAAATAWYRFQDALVEGHHRHPWPHYMVGDDLVQTWLEMSGITLAEGDLERGRALADAIAASTPAPLPDVRTALADADAARREVEELKGHIFGLERTIGFRDKQLLTREQVIRKLRSGGGGTAAGAAVGVGSIGRIARRTAQVRSVDELTAGIKRVRTRAKRARGK
ncbi:hypothetical protein VV01_12355 [Luteipulveratus halotolerans]|uniref:Uncharacterized protein n=1 Tax=Luteipulveratus halotolerans TaxID=1631356 RepID=A0A0L6CIY1_9MICO|nr:hypothetical protein VV01_12355 [Luteipulveratus halotolerans]